MLETVSQNQRHIVTLLIVLLVSIFTGVAVAVITNRVGGRSNTVIIMIFAVVLWLILLRYFEVALALLMIGFPFYVLFFNAVGVVTTPVTTFVFYFLTATSGLVGAIWHNPSKLKYVLKQPSTLFLILLVGWMILSWLLFAFGVPEAQDKVIFAFLLMVSPYVSISLLTYKSLHRFMVAVIGIGTVLLLLALAAFVTGVGLSMPRFSLDENISPLGLAYFLGVTAVFAFVWSFYKHRSMITIFTALGLASVVFVILLTRSRGPIIALILPILIIVSLMRSNLRLQVVLILLLFTVTISSLLPLVPSFSRYERFVPVVTVLQESGQVDLENLDSASAGRMTIWQVSATRWLSSPVTGVGLGNTENVGFAHNFILETLVELGVIGLVLLTLFLGVILRLLRLRPVNREDQILYFAALGLFIFAIVQASFSGRTQTLTTLWVSTGMINALFLISTQDISYVNITK